MACSIGTSSSNTSQPLGLVWCLSTPEAMVALPCGSRSTSSTLRLAAASEAARFTAVVVLPTPPFWLATAMMRAMCRRYRALAKRRARLTGCRARGGRAGALDHGQMALALQPRYGERVHGGQHEARRQPGQFVVGAAALHRQPASAGSEQVAAPAEHVGEAGESARGNAIERALH